MRLPFTRLDPGRGDWPSWPRREWPKTRDWKGYVEKGTLRVLSNPGPWVWSVRRSWQNPYNRYRVEERAPDEGASCNHVLAADNADGNQFSLAPKVRLLIPPDVEVGTIAPASEGGAAVAFRFRGLAAEKLRVTELELRFLPGKDIVSFVRPRSEEDALAYFAWWALQANGTNHLFRELAADWESRTERFRVVGDPSPEIGLVLGGTGKTLGRMRLGAHEIPIETGSSKVREELVSAVAARSALWYAPMLDEIVEELLPTYNASWADGRPLAPSAFLEAVRPARIVIRDDDPSEEWFTVVFSTGLFGGHRIEISCMGFRPLAASLRS
jgi:hypothetical protein